MKKLYTLFALAAMATMGNLNAMLGRLGPSALRTGRQAGRSLFSPQNITLPRRSFSWQTMRNLGQKFPTWQTMHSLRQKLPTWQTIHSLRQKFPTFKSSPFVRTYTPMVLGVGGTVGTLGAAALAKEKELDRYITQDRKKREADWQSKQTTKRLEIEEGLTELTENIHLTEQNLDSLKERKAKIEKTYGGEIPGSYLAPLWSDYTPEDLQKMKEETKKLKRQIIIDENELKNLNWSLNYVLDYWHQFSPDKKYYHELDPVRDRELYRQLKKRR